MYWTDFWNFKLFDTNIVKYFAEFNPFAPGDFAEKRVLKLKSSGFLVTVVL